MRRSDHRPLPNSAAAPQVLTNSQSGQQGDVLSESELSALQSLAAGGLSAEGLQSAGSAMAEALQGAVANSCNQFEHAPDCEHSDSSSAADAPDMEPWEKRQEEREHLEELLAEIDRQEEAARDADAMLESGYTEDEARRQYNEEAARDRWSSLSREGDPQTREEIERSLAELDVEDKLDDVDPVEVKFTAEKKSGAEWAANAQQYFMDHYAGRTFSIGDTGHTLHVPGTKNRAKLATSGVNTQKRNASFRQLEDVISRAIHMGTSEPESREGQSKRRAKLVDHTASFEKYGAPAIINGEKNIIWFNAQTKQKGAKDVLFYEFGVTPMKKEKG